MRLYKCGRLLCTTKSIRYHVVMYTFSKKHALREGWQHFLKRPWLLMGVVLVVVFVSIATDVVLQSISGSAGLLVGLNVVVFILNTVVSMGMMLIMLRAYDGVHTNIRDIVEPVHLFWKYVLATLLSGLAFLVGLLFFVIPGIILQLAFSMALYIIIDKEVGAFAALKESYRITKGHRLNLFLFALLVAALNIGGALFFGLGLLVTIPISLLALVSVYRWLEHPEKQEHVVTLGIGSWLLAGGAFLMGTVFVGFLLWALLATDTSASVRDMERTQVFAQARIALDTYKEIHGVYPFALDTLVPEYLFELPHDPQTNESFLYTVLDNGDDYELCVLFEEASLGLVCEYGTTGEVPADVFDFGE